MTAYRFVERRRRQRGGSNALRVGMVLALLLLLEFYLRPSLVEGRGMPDFLILALLLLAIRQSPGVAALTGFVIGLIIDVLTPAHFGAAMVAHVAVGWGAASGRALFFADNLPVNAALFFVGTWVRNLLVLLLSGVGSGSFLMEALVWSPLQALSTAVVGVGVLVVFRHWLAIRIER